MFGAFFSFLPKAWPIIKNIGIVWDTFRLVQNVLVEISKRDPKIPTKHEVSSLIGAGRKLLDSGVIDLPGVDENEISHILAQIEVRLVSATEKINLDIAKLEESGNSMKGRA